MARGVDVARVVDVGKEGDVAKEVKWTLEARKVHVELVKQESEVGQMTNEAMTI